MTVVVSGNPTDTISLCDHTTIASGDYVIYINGGVRLTDKDEPLNNPISGKDDYRFEPKFTRTQLWQITHKVAATPTQTFQQNYDNFVKAIRYWRAESSRYVYLNVQIEDSSSNLAVVSTRTAPTTLFAIKGRILQYIADIQYPTYIPMQLIYQEVST